MCPSRSTCQLGETLPSVDDVLQWLLRVRLQGFPQFFDQALLQNSFLPFHPTSSSTTWDWIFPFSREVAPALEIASSLQLLSTSSPSICFLHRHHQNWKLGSTTYQLLFLHDSSWLSDVGPGHLVSILNWPTMMMLVGNPSMQRRKQIRKCYSSKCTLFLN